MQVYTPLRPSITTIFQILPWVVICIYIYIYCIYIYIYIYIYARPPPPPMIHTFGLGKGVLGGGRLQTPNFQKKSGVPGPRTPDAKFPEKIWSTRAPDSRLQISRKNLEYPGPGLQTPDFQKKSGVPGPWTPDSGVCNLESGAADTPDFFWKSGVWSPPGTPFWKSGVWSPGPRYSRFFLEIWSPGPRVLQFFSGNLESRGPGTPDFFWKSGVWSPGPRYSRFFLEIWSLESGARVLQILSGNLESGVRYSRFFLEI